MTVTVLYTVLAAVAIVGAGGLLFLRRPVHCLLAFLLCATALAGLYLLLNMQFLAAVQITVGVGLVGAVLAANLSGELSQQRGQYRPWYILATIAFMAVVCWGIVTGAIGESTLTSPPVWAVRGGYIPALGQELTTTHIVPFALLGLLLLVCIVSTTYLLRQHQERDP